MSYGSEEDRRAGRIAIGIVAALVVAGGIWWWSQRGGEEPAVPVIGRNRWRRVHTRDIAPAPVQHPIEVPAESLWWTCAARSDVVAGRHWVKCWDLRLPAGWS